MFGQLGDMKKMYDKYKKLQDSLKNLIIRAKEGSYTNAEGDVVEGSVVVDISGEMKIKDISINDLDLLDAERKEELEDLIQATFQKAQTKAQEVAAEKTKDILGFDPSSMGDMLGGGGMPNIPGLS